MEKKDVILIGPAKVDGIRRGVGWSGQVSEEQYSQLVADRAVAGDGTEETLAPTFDLDSTAAQLVVANAAFDQAKAEITELDAVIKDLKAKAQQDAAALVALQSSKDSAVAGLQKQIDSLKAKADQDASALSSKDTALGDAQSEIEDSQGKIAALTTQVADLTAKLAAIPPANPEIPESAAAK